MSFFRILVIAAMIFLIMPTTIKATLHSDTVLGNGETWVDINRYITRGGTLLPLFYTSKNDLYAYPLYTICELKEVYYKDVLDLYKDMYDFKSITIYDDLRIVIYENYFPYDVKNTYNEVKDADHHEYCEIAMVTNDERMKWPYVVEIEDEKTPIGNRLFWWTPF